MCVWGVLVIAQNFHQDLHRDGVMVFEDGISEYNNAKKDKIALGMEVFFDWGSDRPQACPAYGAIVRVPNRARSDGPLTPTEAHGTPASGVPDSQILQYRMGAIPPYCYA